MGKLESVKLFFWNPSTRKCLGRTGDSWLKLIGFYIALYIWLATFWTVLFYMFHFTISDKYPKHQLAESLIGTNPGLGLRPQSPHDRVDSALISFRKGQDGDFQHWVEDLRDFVEYSNVNLNREQRQMQHQQNGSGGGSQSALLAGAGLSDSELAELRESCSSLTGPRNTTDQRAFCPFDNSSIPAECSASQNFSFPLGQPCILVKLNRIYGWIPEPYDERPPNYPAQAPFTPGRIQITCEGQHAADKEHLGPVEYHPPAGIDTKYYPFLNQPGYQSPYVMVHFKEPRLETLIYVECRAWAKNVAHDRNNKRGLVLFELFIEREQQQQQQ